MIKLPELIFNTSRKGKTGISVSLNKFSDDLISIDKNKLRSGIEDFPSLSEVETVRHFSNLSRLNHSVDNGFYPLGSCTMKYNPKLNEDMARLAGLDHQ